MTDPLMQRILQAKGLLAELLLELGSDDEIPFSAPQCDLLEKRFYEINVALDGDHDPHELDIHALLAARKQIAAIWGVEDLQGIRPDLSADQAWDVLYQVGRKHDAEYGISWTTLEVMADILFGPAPETDADEEA